MIINQPTGISSVKAACHQHTGKYQSMCKIRHATNDCRSNCWRGSNCVLHKDTAPSEMNPRGKECRYTQGSHRRATLEGDTACARGLKTLQTSDLPAESISSPLGSGSPLKLDERPWPIVLPGNRLTRETQHLILFSHTRQVRKSLGGFFDFVRTF